MALLVDTDVFFAALYAGHARHASAREWLDEVKPLGWGIAVETFLAAMRLLMNPAIMGAQPLGGALAHRVVRTELGGRHPGRLIRARSAPDVAIFRTAVGHRQVMDFRLVQVARDHRMKLATRD